MLKPANNNAGSTNDNSEPILNLPPTVQALFLMNLGIFVIGYFFPQILPDTLVYQLALVPARVTAG